MGLLVSILLKIFGIGTSKFFSQVKTKKEFLSKLKIFQKKILKDLALLEWNIDDELTPNPDFLSGNRLVGASLMRQLRTTPNAGCEIPVQFSGAVSNYNSFSL